MYLGTDSAHKREKGMLAALGHCSETPTQELSRVPFFQLATYTNNLK